MRKLAIVLGSLLAIVVIPNASAQESLLIGRGDLLHIQLLDTPEMEQHARVTDAGQISVTGAGMLSVSGLTPAQAAGVIRDALVAQHYMNHPEVTLSVEQYATQNVSILGEVKVSGSFPITTARSIIDVLALAGGLNEAADRNILISRRGNPTNPVHYYVSNDPAQAVGSQVYVYPGDTIVVPRAGIVYVLGDVNRPGGYIMGNNESKLTVLQVVAIAGGLTKSAKQSHAHLIRKAADGTYSDHDLAMSKLEEGSLPDIPLLPGDVLFFPFSYARNIATNGAAGIVSSAAGAAVYTIP